MTDNTAPEDLTVKVGDEVMFRLIEGRRPLVYADAVVRVSYEIGMSVIHSAEVWRYGHTTDGTPAVELDDGTIVAIADIAPESVILNPTASMRQAVEE